MTARYCGSSGFFRSLLSQTAQDAPSSSRRYSFSRVLLALEIPQRLVCHQDLICQ
jgi:hypothetical protein